MNPSRKLSVVILAIMVVVAIPHQAVAGTPTVTSLTQTFRNSGQNQNGVQGDYFTSYTAVTLRSAKWSFRGSVSWLSWRDGGGSTSIPDDSGPGSTYLTVGRRIWRTRTGGFASSGWLRLRGKVPLQNDYDATGSGQADWGGSLYTTHRIGAVSVLAEFGYMDLGSPTGFNYDSLASFVISASYRRWGSKLYPVVGYAASSAARPGDPSYGEWSLGFGAIITRWFSLNALYSRGTTDISPEYGVAVSAWFRL